MALDGDIDVALTLRAAVGTRNDTRGPFAVGVPFVYSSSLRVSGSVHTHVTMSQGRFIFAPRLSAFCWSSLDGVY